MIIRLVKMEFEAVKVPEFKTLFEARKAGIRAFDGCLLVSLLQDRKQPNIFFTYSHWETEAALEAYRQSEFFKDTWVQTKALFAGKAAAWSVSEVSSAG